MKHTKKFFKRNSITRSPRIKPDEVSLTDKIQLQLVSIERKIDSLLNQGRPVARPAEGRDFSKPYQHAGPSQRHGEVRPESNYRERVLHKAVCADCKKECEVPFKPSGDRPVYCKDCFSKRKTPVNNPVMFKPRQDNESREDVVVRPKRQAPRRGKARNRD